MTTPRSAILGPLAATHWGARILAAEARGAFTEDDEADAGDWATCACGSLDGPGIERGEMWGEPLDADLRHLGNRFMRTIANGDAPEAARTLVAIEERAAELAATAEAP
jgi:hypothetical protein